MKKYLDTPTSVVEFLLENDVLRFGNFTLKSGKQSPFFLDIGRIANGKALDTLGHAFSQIIEQAFPQTNTLIGPAYKGISLATAVVTARFGNSASSWDVAFNRKEAKTHGEGGEWFGTPLTSESRAVIIDDVISDGGTKIEMLAHLREKFNLSPLGVAVVVDRTLGNATFDFPIVSLLKVSSLANILQDMNHPQAAAVQTFLSANK
jgi:orotate phosphoribosyltransferase